MSRATSPKDKHRICQLFDWVPDSFTHQLDIQHIGELVEAGASVGTAMWFIEMYAYVSKEKLDVIINLLFCVRTSFWVLELLKSKRLFQSIKSFDPVKCDDAGLC